MPNEKLDDRATERAVQTSGRRRYSRKGEPIRYGITVEEFLEAKRFDAEKARNMELAEAATRRPGATYGGRLVSRCLSCDDWGCRACQPRPEVGEQGLTTDELAMIAMRNENATLKQRVAELEAQLAGQVTQ